MGEFRLRAVADIIIHLLPGAVIFADVFAVSADRQQFLEAFDFTQQLGVENHDCTGQQKNEDGFENAFPPVDRGWHGVEKPVWQIVDFAQPEEDDDQEKTQALGIENRF